MSKQQDCAQQTQPQAVASFFVIWTAQAVSLLGSQLVQFALVWWLIKMTGSATVLALATLMAILPQVLLGPFAGALVDRWNRRLVMVVVDGLIALATLPLAMFYALHVVRIWHIYVVMLIRAAGGAFHWPAMQASTTLMMPQKHLSRVAGLNQTLWGVAGIVSAPLGALLLGLLPMHGVLAIDVGTAMLAIAPLFFISVPQPQRTSASGAEGRSASVLTDLREGLSFVWGWPGLVMILAIATLPNLLVNPGFSLLPILVVKHFRGGPLQLAWLESAWGLGMVAAGLTPSVWGGFKRRAVTGLLALALQGGGLTMIGPAPPTTLMLAVGSLCFAGFMNPI